MESLGQEGEELIFHGLSFSNSNTKYFIRTLAVLLVIALALCIGGCKKKHKDRTPTDGETESLTSALDTDISSEKLENTDDEPTAGSDSAGLDGTSRMDNAYAETSVTIPEGTHNSNVSSGKDTVLGNSHQGDIGQSADKKESSKEAKPSLESTPTKQTDSLIKDDDEKQTEPTETSAAEPSANTYHNGIELPDIFF